MSATNQPGLDELVFFEGDEDLDKFTEDEMDNDPTASKEGNEGEDNDDDNNENEDDVNTDLEDNNEDDSEQDDEDESVYVSQFNYLKDLGLIAVPDDYKFDGKPESLESLVEATKENATKVGAQMIWQSLPDDFKIVLEYALAGGTDISKIQNLVRKDIDYSSLDLEDESDQELVIRQALKKTTKFDDKKIDSYIKKAKLAGTLDEEAENALEDLKKYDEEEKQALLESTKQQQLEKQQALVEGYQKYVETVNKLENVDKKRKDAIVQSVWSVGNYGDFKEISYFNYVDYLVKTNPEHLVQLAQIYLSYDTEKGFINNELQKKAESQAKAKLRDVFDKFENSSGKAKVKEQQTTPKKRGQLSEADKLQAWLQQTRL